MEQMTEYDLTIGVMIELAGNVNTVTINGD